MAPTLYRWLWLSPLVTVPTMMLLALSFSFFYDPGFQMIWDGVSWYHPDWDLAKKGSTLIPFLGASLWHLILLFPALNKKSEFIRWHGWQALLLAGVRTAVPLVFGLAFGFQFVLFGFNLGFEFETSLLFVPALIPIWLFGTLWYQRQAARGDCSLMRWFGRAEALPFPGSAREKRTVRRRQAEQIWALLLVAFVFLIVGEGILKQVYRVRPVNLTIRQFDDLRLRGFWLRNWSLQQPIDFTLLALGGIVLVGASVSLLNYRASLVGTPLAAGLVLLVIGMLRLDAAYPDTFVDYVPTVLGVVLLFLGVGLWRSFSNRQLCQ